MVVILIDVDECLLLNGGCHQLCINTEGSNACDCEEGFQLMEDEINCEGQPVKS